MRNALTLGALLLCLVGCSDKDAPPDSPVVRPAKVIMIALSETRDSLALAGEVRARHEVPLAFQVGGKVVERSAELGSSVKRGQVLGRIESTDYRLASDAQQADLASARAQLSQAEADLKRFTELRKQGFVSESDLVHQRTLVDTTRARVQAAEATKSERTRQIDYTRLIADSDGVITALNFNVGQVVAAGQPVLHLARPGEREIAVHVPESALGRFRAAAGYEISVNALPGKSFNGQIREISAAADPLTRSYPARIRVTDGGNALLLNMSATISLTDKANPAIRLPLSAVFSRDGVRKVWTLNPQTSTVHAVSISASMASGNDWVVSAGLKPGDMVIVAGANLLQEGQKVRPQQ